MVRFKHQDGFLIGSLLNNEPPNTTGCRGLTQSFCSLGAGTRNAQAVRASHLLHTQDTAKPYSYLEHQSALSKADSPKLHFKFKGLPTYSQMQKDIYSS